MKTPGRNERQKDWRALRDRLAAAAEETAANSAGREKQILEERARRLAEPLEEIQRRNLVELTGFVLDGERHAIENRYVWEVVRPGPVTRVPGCPDWVIGLTSIRGEIVLVIDLRRFFGLPGTASTDSSRLVVCGTEAAELAIVVDQIEGAEVVSAEDIEVAPAVLTGTAREFTRGVTKDAVVVLDGAALLADSRFFIDHDQAKET